MRLTGGAPEGRQIVSLGRKPQVPGCRTQRAPQQTSCMAHPRSSAPVSVRVKKGYVLTQPDYTPIDCLLHDRLESATTLRTTVTIACEDNEGVTTEIDDRINDVFTKGNEEFIQTASGLIIRLDRLISVDGVSFRPTI